MSLASPSVDESAPTADQVPTPTAPTDDVERPQDAPGRIVTGAALAIVALTLLVAARFTAGRVTNPDTYFHLRIGAEFLGGWAPWSPGRLTEFGNAAWHPTQWLGQVAMASAERALGLPGVSALTALVVLAMVVSVFLCARSQGSLIVSAAVLPVVVLAVLPGLSGRPQVVSYALAAVVSTLWLRAHDRGTVPWLVIPITWVWAMTHGMWSVSFVISLVAVAGMALDRRIALGDAWKYVAVPLLSLLTAFVTPVGPGLVSATAQVAGISKFFSEWGPTRFTEPPAIAGSLLLVLVLVTFVRSREPMPWFLLGLALLAAAWLAYSNRTVPVGAAMLAPLVARISVSVSPRAAPRRAERIGVAAAVAVAAALACVLAWAIDSDPRGSSKAYASLESLPAGTALLTDWGEGGYALWRFPDLEVVSHGYGDMFTAEEIQRNADLDDASPGWRDVLADLGIEHAILPTESDLALTLEQEAGWVVVATDDESISPSGTSGRSTSSDDEDEDEPLVPPMVHLKDPAAR